MAKKALSYPIALRLLSTIVPGMLALSVSMLYATHRLVRSAQGDVLMEFGHMQDVYANEITRQLVQAQRQIGSIGVSYLTKMMSGADMRGHARHAVAAPGRHGLLHLCPGLCPGRRRIHL